MDAGSVGVDAGSVGVDPGSIHVDQGSQQISDGSVSSDIKTLQTDFADLQAAEAAIPSYQPAGLPGAGQVDQAVKSANASVTNGDQLVTNAINQVQAMLDQANQDAATAQSVCS